MGKEREELEKIFEIANDSFLRNNRMLFETKVSERTLCGALMLELHEVLRKTRYFEYFVDVEYNRNAGGKLKTFKRKFILLEYYAEGRCYKQYRKNLE